MTNFKIFSDRNLQRLAIILSLVGLLYLIPKMNYEIYGKCWDKWPNQISQNNERFVCNIVSVADPLFISIEIIAFVLITQTSFFQKPKSKDSTNTLKHKPIRYFLPKRK